MKLLYLYCRFYFVVNYIFLTLNSTLYAFRSSFRNRPVTPVRKEDDKPVLTFVDPQTKCKILLVGVTHGSEVSAQLAKETIEKYKPSALVLELCQDRYLSMCVESKIPPIGNQTLSNLYKMQLQRYEDRRQKRSTATKIGDPFQNVLGTFRFAIGQGIVGGYVVIMGTFLSSLQRLFSKNNGDEFIAAMKTSQELKIPIRLGDAPQNDTISSFKKVISSKTLNPSEAFFAAKQLAFSAFGVLPFQSDAKVASKIDSNVLRSSEWINIPSVYATNLQNLKAIGPFILIYILGLIFSFIENSASPLLRTTDVPFVPGFDFKQVMEMFSSSTFYDFFQPFQQLMSFEEDPIDVYIERIIDVLSFFLMIRMTKLIGVDRDKIIASKVKQAAREFQGGTLVVVIGMLHCNGVARWLLSGADPMTVEEEKD